MPRKGSGQKVQVETGQTYGDRVAQEEAQEAIPLPKIAPGQMGPVGRPSERPSEPLTAGAPIGAGANQSVLPQPSSSEMDVLSTRLASYIPILEAKAAMPEATANFRMFVRRVRNAASKSPNSLI